MSSVDIKRLVQNISTKTSVYTPIIEAIVNSIQSVQESGRLDGKIDIYLIRENQTALDFEWTWKPKIISLRIEDNWIWFNAENYKSFDKVYSSKKIIVWWKWFWRFTFLKYFTSVKYDSIYRENGAFMHRFFNFCEKDEFIDGEKSNIENDVNDTKTILTLGHFKKDHAEKIEKTMETISRVLVEKLLIYFLDPKCPEISVHDGDGMSILLNNYTKNHKEIQEIWEPSIFSLKKEKNTNDFIVRTFKIFFSDGKSSIILAAHNREVTKTSLSYFVPEFADEFCETDEEGIKRNYIIRSYVLGNYLDEHVSLERDEFTFSRNHSWEFDFSFSEEDIQRWAIIKIKEIFWTEVWHRREKKIQRVHDYVRNSAPWHSAFVDSMDWETLGYNLTDDTLEIELQKVKIMKEAESRMELKSILTDDAKNNDSKIEELAKRITDAWKNDLIHHVCNRKMILSLLEGLLKRKDDGASHLEKEVHNIIFPMGQDTTTLGYNEHNLWLLDERLAFSVYAASDKKISSTIKNWLSPNWSKKEPDLVVFDKAYAFRSWDNEYSNPLTIFEFKRPKRTDYPENENPIKQVYGYLKDIIDGKYETPDTLEKPKVKEETTPVYAYIIADRCDKIDSFATDASLYPSPDWEGYFGYHSWYKMYIHIYTYSKILKDANLRNSIFFHHLNLPK